MHAINRKLATLIETHGWHSDFELAIENAQAKEVPSLHGIQSLSDYLAYVDDLVTWAPRERNERASNVHLISRPGVHSQQGTWIGSAFPCR